MSNTITDLEVLPEAPKGLQEAGLALWESTTEVFDLSEEPHKLKVLERACKTADTISMLETEATTQPLIAKGSMGQPVINPLIAEARAQTTVLNTLLKSIGLPDSDEVQVERAIKRQQTAKAGAKARWGRNDG